MNEISHLEKRLDSHASEIKEIRSLLSAIPGQIQHGIQQAVRQAIEAVGGRRSTDAPKTECGSQTWQMSLIFTVLFSMGAFFYQQISSSQTYYEKQSNELKQSIAKLHGELRDHSMIKGHADALQLHASANTKIVALNEEQKETKKYLEKRLSKTDSVREKILDWQMDHDNRVVKINSSHDVRLDHIEKKLDFWEQTGFFSDVAKGNVDSVQNEKLRWLEKSKGEGA